MKTKLFITAVTFMAFTVMASAQTTGQANTPAGQGKAQGAAWVDANNDGICDNYASGERQGRGPGHGKGQGQAYGAGHGQCKGQGQGLHHGHGKGQGAAAGNGQCGHEGKGPAFVDANNDGVCDNISAPAPKK